MRIAEVTTTKLQCHVYKEWKLLSYCENEKKFRGEGGGLEGGGGGGGSGWMCTLNRSYCEKKKKSRGGGMGVGVQGGCELKFL